MGCKLNKLFLGTRFGDSDIYPCAAAFGQPFFDKLRILYLVLEHQFPRQEGRSRIKLLYKFLKDLRRLFFRHVCHIIMLAPYKLSVPHKEYLDNDLFPVPAHRDNVFVISVIIGYLLLLRNTLYTLMQVAELCRLLKFKSFGSAFHPLFEVFKYRPVIAVQKFHRTRNLLRVFFLRNRSHTGRGTLPYVMIKAGPSDPDISREHSVACTQHIYLVQQFYCVFYRSRTAVGSEVF